MVSRKSSGNLRRVKENDPKSVLIFYDGVVKIIVAISSLFITFTFSYILTDPIQPTNPIFTVDRIRFFLALSWLLYLIAFTLGLMVKFAINVWGDHLIEHWKENRGWPLAVFVMSTLLTSSMAAPFTVLCLVIIAYEKSIGVTGLSLNTVTWVNSIIFFAIRLKMAWRDIKSKRNAEGQIDRQV